jgi:hypothetical protein
MHQEIVLFVASLLLHWKIILGATICMDGWILESWKKNSSPESKVFFRSAGIPLVGSLHSIIKQGRFSQQIYGITIVLSIATTNVAFLGILQNLQPNNSGMNYTLTLIFMTYSGKQMAIDMVVGLQYIFSYATYLLAIFLLTNLTIQKSLNEYLLFLAVLPLLLLSFSTKSLLFTHVAISFLSGVYLVLNQNEKDFIFIAFLNAVLPFVYWIIIEKTFPRIGNYSNYNNFLEFNLKNIIKLAIRLQESFVEGILNPLRRPTESMIQRNLVAGLIIPFVIVGQTSFRVSFDLTNLLLNLIIGLFLFFAWAIPYVIVNQEFDYSGYLSKNNLAADLSFTFVASSAFFLTGSKLGLVLMVCHLVASISSIQRQYNEAIRDYLKNRDLQILFNVKFKDYKGEIVFIDESQWRLMGKKSKLYPMTLFYMLNKSENSASILPSNHYISKPGLLGQNHEIFLGLELPFNKSFLELIPTSSLTIVISDRLAPTQLNTFKVYGRYLLSRWDSRGSSPLGIVDLSVVSEYSR